MQCYVINLEARPARMAFMQRQLDDLGMPFTRINAINGLSNPAQVSAKSGITLSGTERACYHSHLLAYAAFIKSDAPLALILEDDMQLARTLPAALEFTEKHHPRGSLIRLEIPIQSLTNEATIVARRLVAKDETYSMVRLLSCVYGAGAYVIGRSLAQQMLSHYATPELAIDCLLLCKNKIMPHRPKIMQLDPPQAVQNRYLEKTGLPEINDSDLEESRLAIWEKINTQNVESFQHSLEASTALGRALKRRQRNFIYNTTAIYHSYIQPVQNWLKALTVKPKVFALPAPLITHNTQPD